MERRVKAKVNIPMCVACVLLCLTLFTTYLTGGLFARYTTQGEGSDSARVAKFDVTHDGAYFSESLHIKTAPGETMEKVIEVSNKSEVAVEYVVTITNTTDNVPYLFSVNGSTGVKKNCTVSSTLAPNETKTVEIRARFEPEGATAFIGMVDIVTISVVAQQLD